VLGAIKLQPNRNLFAQERAPRSFSESRFAKGAKPEEHLVTPGKKLSRLHLTAPCARHWIGSYAKGGGAAEAENPPTPDRKEAAMRDTWT
jgi:hypothetical protein